MAIDYERMSPAEQAEYTLHKEPPRKNKYGATRTEYSGEMYDSKAEAEHAAYLDLSPFVSWWLRQVWIPLGPDFGTRIDFLVAVREGKFLSMRGDEVKGVETARFRMVRRHWPKYAPFPLHIVKCGEHEVIEGKP